MPVDYPNTMGVYWIEDTEDFLERIGHLGLPESMEPTSEAVMLDLMNSNLDPEVVAALLHDEIKQRTVEAYEDARKHVDNTWYGDHAPN